MNKDKICVVTGGSNGIGLDCANIFFPSTELSIWTLSQQIQFRK